MGPQQAVLVAHVLSGALTSLGAAHKRRVVLNLKQLGHATVPCETDNVGHPRSVELLVVLLALALVAKVDGVGCGGGGSLLPCHSCPLVRRCVVGAAMEGVAKAVLHRYTLTGGSFGVEHAGSRGDEQAIAAL